MLDPAEFARVLGARSSPEASGTIFRGEKPGGIGVGGVELEMSRNDGRERARAFQPALFGLLFSSKKGNSRVSKPYHMTAFNPVQGLGFTVRRVISPPPGPLSPSYHAYNEQPIFLFVNRHSSKIKPHRHPFPPKHPRSQPPLPLTR